MSQLENIKNFWANNRKWINIVLAAVVSLLFIGSILLAVFIGGELKSGEQLATTKGLLRVEGDYGTSYIDGDKFVFDKKNAGVMLVAKDTVLDKVVKVDNLPEAEYGFQVNGEGEIYYDASQIALGKDVYTVDIVSKQYPDVKLPIDVKVYASLDDDEFTDEITLEAEAADLYTGDGTLLTEEQKATLPDGNKPYLSNKGTTTDGADCSGGACIRNFSAGMKMQFSFASGVSGEYNLTVKLCKRPSATSFDSSVVIEFNGEKITTGVTIPGGTGYYQTYEFQIPVYVQRGLNTVAFTSNGSTCNMDALVLEAAEGVKAFGDSSCVGEVINIKPVEDEEPEEGGNPEEEAKPEETPEGDASEEQTTGE